MVTYIFLAAAVVAIAFAIVTVVHRNPVVNVLSLVVVFFALAAVYAILGMDFLAAVQIIVYSGAVLVLFLFVIMLLNLRATERIGSGRRMQAVLGLLVALAVPGALVAAIIRLRPAAGATLPGSARGTAFPIGHALLTTHLFAFEFISLLLLAAIVGAFILARRESR